MSPVGTQPSPKPSALKAFLEIVERGIPESNLLNGILPKLRAENTLEQAFIHLKRIRPTSVKPDPWQEFRLRLREEVEKSRTRRTHAWQTDPLRRTLRLRMEVLRPLCNLHPPMLLAAIAQTLLDAGLPVAMGLEKTPRPAIQLGHPLPCGVEGHSEWADVVLRAPSTIPIMQLPSHLSSFCPVGLRILETLEIPNISSPVLELCREAHWKWACPESLREKTRERMLLFEAAPSYEIQKTGKVGGQKQTKQVEVRHLITGFGWEEDHFCFTTHLAVGEALNPIKLLAGILEIESSVIQDLVRIRVDLAEDPRLSAADKYEPKLHNIYEDAVLLTGGSNIQIVDDEDDEPIRMNIVDPS